MSHVTHLDVVGAGLEVLENNVLSSATIESARFMNNKISYIEADAFRYTYYAHFQPTGLTPYERYPCIRVLPKWKSILYCGAC